MSFSNTAGQPDYKLLLFLGKGDIVDGEKTDVWKRQREILVFHKEKAWNSSLHARKLFVILVISVYVYMYIYVFFRFTELSPCHWKKKIPMTFDLQFEQSDVYYVPGEKSRKKIPSTSSIFLTGVELFPTGMSAVKAVVPESVCVCVWWNCSTHINTIITWNRKHLIKVTVCCYVG